jgi:ATP-dependent exoDNAse (exonuclease V) alpha subunit
MIELTKTQNKIQDDIFGLVKEQIHGGCWPDCITLGGLAGTGKSVLISFMADKFHKQLNLKIAFVTFTGKASIVLFQKLKEANALKDKDYVGTVHGLIYYPVVDDKGELIAWTKRESLDYDLIIIDEASMIYKDMYKDLASYGLPILAVGDHGQLPPVGEDSFNLMSNPDFVLDKIHRQAADNPIIKMSMWARKEGRIPMGIFGDEIMNVSIHSKEAKESLKNYLPNEKNIFLCGTNRTRVKINSWVRRKLGYKEKLVENERIICLKNNKELGIVNGALCNLISFQKLSDDIILSKVKMDGFERVIKPLIYSKGFGVSKVEHVFKEMFNVYNKKNKELPNFSDTKIDVFDYGYAISVHKSQGSAYEKVFLINERNPYQSDDDYARWLYTAITRAEKKLIILEDY